MREDFMQYWKNISTGLSDTLPSLLMGVAVLIAGYLIAVITRKLTRKLILRVSTELNRRINIRNAKINLNDLATFTSRAAFWIVLVITFSLFIQMIELKVVNEFFEHSREFIPDLILAIVIVVGGIFAGRFLSRILETYNAPSGLGKRSFVSTALRYFILFIALIIASDQVGIQVGLLMDLIDIIIAMILLGAALSFGLGSKDSVSNILASHNLKKDYHIGSTIRYENLTGTIVKLTSNSVHIDSSEGIVIIPARKFREGIVVILNEESNDQ